MSRVQKDTLAYSPVGSHTNSPLLPRILGSGIAGLSELLLFHPVDTVAKRMMSNNTKISNLSTLNSVIFRNAANASAFNKWKSLFPGLGFAAGYKILQRVYKFGGQPYVKDYLSGNQYFKGMSPTLVSSISGAIMGVGEVVLLPLDVLKIKSQTNPQALQGRNIFNLILTERSGLYRGAGMTALRNAPGSFALFGGSELAHQFFKKRRIGNETSTSRKVFENFVASVSGAACSILVAAPLDTVKTRIQSMSWNEKSSGRDVIVKLVREEGVTAFFKGVVPKLAVVGPKLVFSFTVAQTMIDYLQRVL